jgi:hypothetical protein
MSKLLSGLNVFSRSFKLILYEAIARLRPPWLRGYFIGLSTAFNESVEKPHEVRN